jgi:ABC-2 type transport system ATP-binding protein
VTAVAAVRASGLVKRFETTVAVDDVDLVVKDGEVRGLLGPNGAGKTTLLRMLFGLVAPEAGEVELLGRPLGPPDAVRLDGVAGFVEEPAFYPYLSGRVNLELLAELDGSDEARGRVEAALDQVGLSGRGEDRVSGYSTGMRQRLGIAAALLRAPALLLLDEPTSGLDPAGVREVGALLRRLASDGTAVLLSSHLIGEIEDICDSFTVLRRGRVVWSGTAAQLRDQAPGSAYRFSTGDDERALQLAARHPGISVTPSPSRELRLAARTGSLDDYVLELGYAGVAVRRLELLISPLESMFFALTSDADPGEAGAEELAERVLAGT